MNFPLSLRNGLLVVIAAAIAFHAHLAAAQAVPVIAGVAAQPLGAQATRVAEALRFLGQPLSETQQQSLDRALQETDEKKMVATVQEILDPLTLAFVTINPESRVKATAGVASPALTQNGWTAFLIKVHNRAGVTAPLVIESSNAAPIFRRSRSSSKPNNPFTPKQLRDRWLSIETYNKPPLKPVLSGLPVEYRIALLYSRDSGQREATLSFKARKTWAFVAMSPFSLSANRLSRSHCVSTTTMANQQLDNLLFETQKDASILHAGNAWPPTFSFMIKFTDMMAKRYHSLRANMTSHTRVGPNIGS